MQAHSKNFNVGVQALMLIFKISSKNQIVSDRFYRALYSKLLLPSAMNISNVSKIVIIRNFTYSYFQIITLFLYLHFLHF